MKRVFLLLALVLSASVFTISCREKKDAKTQIEEAVEKTGDALEKAADETGEAIEKLGEDVDKAIEEVKDTIEDN